MYELGIILIVAPLTFIVLPNILVPFMHWCDGTGEFSPEAKRRRKLLRRLGQWEMELEWLRGSEDSADYIHAEKMISMLRRELCQCSDKAAFTDKEKSSPKGASKNNHQYNTTERKKSQDVSKNKRA